MSFAPENVSRRHLITGKKGEAFATRFLKKEGYKIVVQNYRNPLGEIDIIALEGETLVFVEVKTRTGKGFGLPQAAVDLKKQSKITRVALSYLSNLKSEPALCRFDVVAVQKNVKGYQVELIRNAFEMAINF